MYKFGVLLGVKATQAWCIADLKNVCQVEVVYFAASVYNTQALLMSFQFFEVLSAGVDLCVP